MTPIEEQELERAKQNAIRIRQDYDEYEKRIRMDDYENSKLYADDLREAQLRQQRIMTDYYNDLREQREKNFLQDEDYKIQKAFDDNQWIRNRKAGNNYADNYQLGTTENGKTAIVSEETGNIAYANTATDYDYLEYKRRLIDMQKYEYALQEEMRKIQDEEEKLRESKMKAKAALGIDNDHDDVGIMAINEKLKEKQIQKMEREMQLDHQKRLIDDYTKTADLDHQLKLYADAHLLKQNHERNINEQRAREMNYINKPLDDVTKQTDNQLKNALKDAQLQQLEQIKIQDKELQKIIDDKKEDLKKQEALKETQPEKEKPSDKDMGRDRDNKQDDLQKKIQDIEEQKRKDMDRLLDQKRIQDLDKLKLMYDDDKQMKDQIDKKMRDKILEMQKDDLEKLNMREAIIVKQVLEQKMRQDLKEKHDRGEKLDGFTHPKEEHLKTVNENIQKREQKMEMAPENKKTKNNIDKPATLISGQQIYAQNFNNEDEKEAHQKKMDDIKRQDQEKKGREGGR